MRLHPHTPTSLLLTALLILALGTLPACGDTNDGTTDTLGETAEDAGDLLGEAAGETAAAAEDAGQAVADAAGTAWNNLRELFEDDPDADAAALVRPTSAGNAEGTVRFDARDGALHVAVSLRGLEPGAHGFHIHQNASCDPADTDGDGQPDAAGAAGDHWDPLGTGEHGGPTEAAEAKHLGDLGNLEAGADGTVETTLTVENFPVDEYDVAGHAIVVHASADDLATNPSGESGTRIGCGVIESR